LVEFEDITLIETKGNFDKVTKIMEKDMASQWMLRSKVFVNTENLTGAFILNFWYNKKIIIDEMFRPPLLEIPNDDIVELSQWAKDNGWEIPEPAAKLLDTPIMYRFWERQYQSGIILSSVFEERETDLIERIQKSVEKEK
jgi:hypothetical protein